MKRYVVREFNGPVCEEVEDDPTPAGTEVVVDLQRCGLCHSDLHIQEGFYEMGGGRRLSLADRGINLPLTLGHEILGRVSAIGPDAELDPSAVGRSFIVFPWIGCGECRPCQAGYENLCDRGGRCLGVHRPGGFAEKVVVPHPRYLVDADGLDPSAAATLACSGLTTFSALRKVKADPAEDWILFVGAGGLGQSAIPIARALGFRRIAVADVAAGKRERALAAGADLAVDPADKAALASLRALDGGLATAIDFVGTGETFAFATDALRRSGQYVVVGLFGGALTLPVPAFVIRALTLNGSYVGSLGELRDLVDLVRREKVETVGTETVPLAAVNDAMERLRGGRVSGRLVFAGPAAAA